MNYLPQILTFALFVLGMLVWQKQLIDKRRFEVAEQALVVFGRVSSVIQQLRTRHPWGHLVREDSHKNSHYAQEATWRELRYSIPPEGLTSLKEGLAPLRPTHVLAKMYLPIEIAQDLLVLEGAVQKVKAAASRLVHIDPRAAIEPRLEPEDWQPVGDPDYPEEEEFGEKQIEQHESVAAELLPIRFVERDFVTGEPLKMDLLTMEIEAARARLEKACRPYQVAPSLLRFANGFWTSLVGKDG